MTKILFLMAAGLTFIMSGLVVAYSSNADRLLVEWKKEKLLADQAASTASAIAASTAIEKEQLQSRIKDVEASRITDQERIASLQRENANLLAQVNQLSREKVAHSGQIDQFTAVMQVYARLNDAQAQELGTLRDKELDHARREIDMTDRINDLTGQLEVAQETMRSLMEQNQGLREQLAAAGGSGTLPAGFTSARGPTRAPRGFEARVTAVDQGANGMTLVQIGAGANDRLEAGMELNLIRGQEFLGKVIIQHVTPNEAVGRIDYLNMGKKRPRVSDVVKATL